MRGRPASRNDANSPLPESVDDHQYPTQRVHADGCKSLLIGGVIRDCNRTIVFKDRNRVCEFDSVLPEVAGRFPGISLEHTSVYNCTQEPVDTSIAHFAKECA
jgi:hypothetical protein